jgi:SAM-dependent methyltransferase
VFNRLAADYRARPGYPAALVARLAALAGGPGARAADLGAGAGALAVPLARAGLAVHAVEPARAMLDGVGGGAGVPRLRPACGRAMLGMNGPGVVPVHAAAEETGLPAAAFDLVVLADALQWIDPERGAREAARLLAPGGVLAVVTPRLADTPFLAALAARIARANFKARPSPPPIGLFFANAGLSPPVHEPFEDEVVLEPERLDAVLRSLSYVGPAIGPAALEALLADARELAEENGGAVWRREIALAWARRAR